jgi:BirA family biotin operon repressor/biotin-[acetyl-CoA-carboxylase] ligase
VQGHFLVVADEQSSGRGRRGKEWHSPTNGLWFSAGFQNLPEESNLTIFIGLCLQRAIAELLSDPSLLKLKWPNDLLYDGRKLAGILVERPAPSQYHVVGVGLNTNNTEFPAGLRSTSLKLIENREFDHEDLLTRIFGNFFSRLPRFVDEGIACCLDEYRSLDYLKGRELLLDTEYAQYRGIAVGIGRDGALLLRLDGGMIQPFYFGSIKEYSEKIVDESIVSTTF